MFIEPKYQNGGCRYSFDFTKSYFWKDIWKPRIWKMWGIKKTLLFICTDWKN